jgi:hypothetical protein
VTITVDLTAKEREACDEMRGILGLKSDAELMRAALYKLANWCEPDIDTTLFRQRPPEPPPLKRVRRGREYENG